MPDIIKNQFNHSTLNNPSFNFVDREIPHILTPPPFRPETFCGREIDLEHIHDRLFAPDNNLLLLVNGERGIGKTTLAAEYFHKYQSEYAHIAWILSEKSIINALLLLTKPLHVQLDEQMKTEERIDNLLVTLTNLEKPSLLVIDNVNELDDLKDNYQLLRRCSNFYVLLTTRITHFAYAKTYAVNQLSQDRSLELFEFYYRNLEESEKTLFFQIREAVDGNTLILEILAKNLAEQNHLRQQYSLENLLSDLQSKGLFQLTHSQEVSTDYQSQGKMRRETPESIIAAMYDLSELVNDETALLSVFAVLPAGSIVFSILETLLPSLPNLKDHLQSLSQKGWIGYNKTTASFKCSPVIQEVVQQKNPNLRRDCTVIVRALIEKLDYEGDHHIGANYDDGVIYAKCANRLLALFQNDIAPNRELADLNDRTAHFYLNVGDIDQSLNIFASGNRLATNFLEKNPTNIQAKITKAISHQMLGEVYKKKNEMDLTLFHFQVFHSLANDLYSSANSPKNEFYTTRMLAASYEKLGDYFSLIEENKPQALNHYKKNSDLLKHFLNKGQSSNESSFKRIRKSLAISYRNIGSAYHSLGALDKALKQFKKSHYELNGLHQQLKSDPEIMGHLASSCQNLSKIYIELSALKKACFYLMKSNRLSRNIHLKYPENAQNKLGLATSYKDLGDFFENNLKDINQAKQNYCHSKTLFEQLIDYYPNLSCYEEHRSTLNWLADKLNRD